MPDKPRNAYGLGSVYIRARDQKWLAVVNLPPGPDGKRRRHVVTGTTEAEARRAQQQALAAHARHQLATSRQTVAAYLEDWLTTVVEPRLPHATAYQYRAVLTQRLVPLFGHHPLAKLSAQEVQRAYAKLSEAGYAPSTVQHTHTIFAQALEQAVRWDLIPRNVARLTVRPRREKSKPPVFSEQEARQLLAAAEADPDGALWVLALTSGMRHGELLALRWADLDLERGRLILTRSVRLQPGGQHLEKGPKSDAGIRTFRLAPSAVAALRRHRQAQRVARVQAATWAEQDLVFPGPSGSYQYQAAVRRRWRGFLKRAGVPYQKLHNLRHTNISARLAIGEPVTDVSASVGHSSPAITLAVYSHAIRPHESSAAERFDAWLHQPPDAAENP
jgi:integrase